MNLATLWVFLPACFALNLAPGPNNLLSIHNATRYGYRLSCLAGIGRLLAFAVMIALAGAGLATVLQTSQLLFHGIKLSGACYLLYLAYRLWTADTAKAAACAGSALSLGGLARQEFLMAAGNPKAILIFTAFLPQFVDPAAAMAPQFLQLGLLFLLLEWVAIGIYAFIGLRLQPWFSELRGRRLFNRCCAALLSAAASVLLTARRG